MFPQAGALGLCLMRSIGRNEPRGCALRVTRNSHRSTFAKNKHYRYMVIEEEEEDTLEDEQILGTEQEGEQGGNLMRLDVITFIGLSTSKSRRLWGQLGDTKSESS